MNKGLCFQNKLPGTSVHMSTGITLVPAVMVPEKSEVDERSFTYFTYASRMRLTDVLHLLPKKEINTVSTSSNS